MDKKESWLNMGKTSTNAQGILPEFQKYLLEKKLAPERNITFLAYWVSRFLTAIYLHSY